MDTPIRRLRMEDELWQTAERVAADLERSVSWVIRKALEEFIENHRAQKRKVREKADASRKRDRSNAVKR